MTGTFKIDAQKDEFVFRDEAGNSVSYNAKARLWEHWRNGGVKIASHAFLAEALREMSRGV